MRKIYFLFLVLLFACNDSNSRIKNLPIKIDITFSPDNWKKGNAYNRGCMVNDLVNKQILNNISRDSLEMLLGNPLEKSRDLYTYLIRRDTVMLDNYLLFYVQIDTVSYRVVDYWITD